MKAMLILDMPQNCNDCVIPRIIVDETYYCPFTKKRFSYYSQKSERQPDCPLKFVIDAAPRYMELAERYVELAERYKNALSGLLSAIQQEKNGGKPVRHCAHVAAMMANARELLKEGDTSADNI